MSINVSTLVRKQANNIDVDWPTLSRSPEMEKYLTTLMDAVSMEGKGKSLRLRLDHDPQASDIAYTTGNLIYLNMENDLQKQMSSLENRFKVILGILFHELAHVRFNNFDRMYELTEQIGRGEFPVGRPDGPQQDVDELEMALKDPKARGFFQHLYAELNNYAIDAHDEECIIEEYSIPGTHSLVEQSILRTRLCLEAMSTTVDMVVKKADERGNYLGLIMTMIFQYIRFGAIIVKDKDIENHPIVQCLPGFMEDSDIAAHTDDTDERYMALNRIVVKLWPFIREIIEQMKQQSQQPANQQGGQGDSSQAQSGGQQQSAGTQSAGSSSGQQGTSGQSQSESQQGSSSGSTGETADSSAQNGAKGKQQRSSQSDGDSKDAKSDSSSVSSGQEVQESSQHPPITAEDVANAMDQLLNALKDAVDSSKQTVSPKDRTGSGEKSDTKGSRNCQDKSKESESGSDPEEKSKVEEAGSEKDGQSDHKTGDETSEGKPLPSQRQDQLKQELDQDGSDEELGNNLIHNALNALIKAIQEQEAESQVEWEMEQKMRELIRNTDAGSAHRGVPVRTSFAGRPSDADQKKFQKKLSQVKSYSTRIQRSLKQELEMFSKGYTQRYRPFGRGIDARDSYRPDQQFFTNKKLPHDMPEMAVAVLIDRSGSTEGERNRASIDMAILVEDFCRGMRIPVMVAGHTLSTHGGISYKIFSKFDEVQPSSRAKIMQMVPSPYGNRDGLAIATTKALLQQRPEQIKMMFIISDGLPYDVSYSGEPARNDIKEIVRGAEKSGIEVVAAAIGDDKDAIESIYGSSFLDITDLSKLPKTLVTLIKKRIQKNIY